MLTVDRLSLRLPAGFEHRASSIASLVAQQLATTQLSASQAIAHMRVGEVETTASHTDHDIAVRIGQAIQRELGAQGRARPTGGVDAW